MKLSAFLSLTLIVELAGALSLSAQSIPLANAGFEAPTVAVGTNNGGGIPGWQFNQNSQKCSDGTFSTSGVAHPLSSQLAPPSDGSQVGYSHFCGPYSTTAIWQTLPVNYSPNTGYTFTLDFYGDVAPHVPLGASIGFCFGHSTDPGGLNCPPENIQTVPAGGGTVSANLFVSSNDRFLGSPISVIILATSFDIPSNIYFDHARLEATPRIAHSSGIVGMYAHRPGVTSQLNAICSNSTSSPCDVALEFHDIHGVLVSQTETTLRPGQATSLDQPVSRDFMPDAGELIPRWYLKSGNADVSFEIIDSSTMRSNFFVNWADGSVSKMGNLNSGPVGITPFDTVRVKVYCDGSVRSGEAAAISAPCSATLGFADSASGRTLKQSRMVLQPGTAGYLDLFYEDTPQTATREEVRPMITVNGGNAIGGFAILDRGTGGTVTQSFPASSATVGGGDQ